MLDFYGTGIGVGKRVVASMRVCAGMTTEPQLLSSLSHPCWFLRSWHACGTFFLFIIIIVIIIIIISILNAVMM